MTGHTLLCPSCGGGSFSTLHDFGLVPQTGIFLSDPEMKFPSRQLAFQYCTRCACVTQKRSEVERVDYAEVSRGTERQFPAYAEEIVARVAAQCAGSPDILVEVGSNDGTFLTRLRDAGVGRMLGIEPSRLLAEQSRLLGHVIENVALDEAEAIRIRNHHGQAEAVVCRHTLEHVPAPGPFLRAIRHLLVDAGTLFIEVPSIRPVIDVRLQGYELWDEHLTYFSETNLSLLLNAAGFAIERIESRPHCGSENILCWARTSSSAISSPLLSETKVELAQCASFAERWRIYRDKLRQQACQWPRPIVAMGASHPQSNFLNFSGLMPLISALVDDDPAKIGRWVPAGKPVPVVAGNDLLHYAKGGTVLLTGFGYRQWMDRIRSMLEGQGIFAVDPLQYGDGERA